MVLLGLHLEDILLAVAVAGGRKTQVNRQRDTSEEQVAAAMAAVRLYLQE